MLKLADEIGNPRFGIRTINLMPTEFYPNLVNSEFILIRRSLIIEDEVEVRISDVPKNIKKQLRIN